MKIWYDTEFLERGPELPISLISIGMVREDGAELYLINAEMPLSSVMRHPFVSTNVVPFLPVKFPNPGIIEWDEDNPEYRHCVRSRDEIARQVREFCNERAADEETELWAYYGAWDHVVLSQTFGGMTDYLAVMPPAPFDVVQLWAELGYPLGVLPGQTAETQHHAFHDAVWARDAYLALKKWEQDRANDHEGGPEPAEVDAGGRHAERGEAHEDGPDKDQE
jgi:hypothetical protein